MDMSNKTKWVHCPICGNKTRLQLRADTELKNFPLYCPKCKKQSLIDDGISGVTMNRPGFVEMMQQLEQGKASAVFVKDLSRLGRNYIEVGRLTEEFFPDHDIRLVAVSDNIDTAEGENELAPIRNLFNEWYARDISKKRRISNKIKGNSGEPMGLPPYGYIKDPNNPKRWVIDEEAAQVVRRIFDMTLEGFGTEQIATQFEKEGILTPQAYWIQKGIGRPGKSKTRPATKWNGSTITHLLYQQEYCGDVLNFKTYSKSYKNKKRIHYNCVGTIEIPSALPLPTPDVSVNTRKGVVVNYAPCDVAI